MAPKSKYQEPFISDLLEHVANGETDQFTCEKMGIGRDTLVRWKRTKPKFQERYNKALENFRMSCPIGIKRKVRHRLLDVLEHGLIQKHKVTTITDRAVYKGEGEDKAFDHWLEYKRETVEGETNFGVPQWAFDRILPILPDLEQARAIIEKHGYKIIPDPELETIENDINQLKDKESSTNNAKKTLTTEEIDYLKQAVLFKDKEPTEPIIDVSAELANGG